MLCVSSRPLWRFVKIPITWRERRNARWEKWLARWFTKCHLYTSHFSHFANIFLCSRQFHNKCIAGFKLAIHLLFLAFRHVRALFLELFCEIGEPITIHFSQYRQFRSSLILWETWREACPIILFDVLWKYRLSGENSIMWDEKMIG